MRDSTPSSAKPTEAPVIHPRAVYTLAQAQAVLALGETTLAREIRLRRLRSSKRAGRVWILGRWLLEWIEAGESRRGRRKQPAEANGTARN